MTLAWTLKDSPVGLLRLVASPRGLRELSMLDRPAPPEFAAREDPDALRPFTRALDAYFAGDASALEDLPVDVETGTPFQHEVWRALRTIPYGETRSYAWLARAVNRPGGARAVGQANGANPVGIVVPCHRVLAADGSIGGYAGGVERKRVLLDLEAAVIGSRAQAASALPSRRGPPTAPHA